MTADHVFAREFFLSHRRNNLPKVPACAKCNSQKSNIEHYLTAVLPFGGRHLDAVTNLETMVPKRLQRNQKLLAHLTSGRREVGLSNEASLAIPIESSSLDNLFALIAKGLTWHHWRTLLGKEYSAKAMIMATRGESFFNETVLGLNARARVSVNLGEGTILYEGIQLAQKREITVWGFTMYGGILMGGDSELPGDLSTKICAVTGPLSSIDNLGRRVTDTDVLHLIHDA